MLKKDLDIILLYQKYNHKTYLKEEQKLFHKQLYKMSLEKLNVIKRYFDSHLSKRFIFASLASYFLQVLFVKKPKKQI